MSVLGSQALRGEEAKSFHMMYYGAYNDNLSTFTLLKQIAQIPQCQLLARVNVMCVGTLNMHANVVVGACVDQDYKLVFAAFVEFELLL